MRFADLHLHTNFSDGTDTPAELVKKAKEANLSTIAITDHDNVEGILPALEISEEENIELIPAVELTAEIEELEVHILGYLIDYKNKGFLEKLEFLRENRRERIYKILAKLKEMGIELNPQDVFAYAKGGTVGRLHIAQVMLKEGYINSIVEAFSRYIGNNCPAYISGFKLSPKEAINLIRKIDGIPVLAHPYSLNQDSLIPQFIEYGLLGIEVYYPEHTSSMVEFYLNLAKKYNLLITGGSDYHGKLKPQVNIGLSKIPYELVEKLKEAKEKLLC